MRRLPRFPLPIALLIVLSLGASAQDAPIYQRGYTVTENTMPPSPEPASAVKYADVPVTLSQGLVHYEIPFYTLQTLSLLSVLYSLLDIVNIIMCRCNSDCKITKVFRGFDDVYR